MKSKEIMLANMVKSTIIFSSSTILKDTIHLSKNKRSNYQEIMSITIKAINKFFLQRNSHCQK